MKTKHKIRFTIGLTPEQASRLDELNRSRNRKGDTTSRAEMVREAVALYLQQQGDLVGSRKAITKNLEAKIDALDAKVNGVVERLNTFIEMLRRRREGG